MGRKCVAVHCKSSYKKGGHKVHFHRFPQKKELRDKWVAAMRRKGFHPTPSSRLCSDHFLEDNYKKWDDKRHVLKNDAVPSQFNRHAVPSPFDHLKYLDRITDYEKSISSNDSTLSIKTEVTDEPVTANGSSNRQVHIITLTADRSASQTESQLNNKQPKCEPSIGDITEDSKSDSDDSCKTIPDKLSLKKKIKVLQQTVRRRDRKIEQMKTSLIDLKYRENALSDVHEILQKYFDGFLLELLVNDLNNQDVEPPARTYSPDIKQFAITVYYHSPKVYKYLRTLLALPHPSRIRSSLSEIAKSKS